MAYASAAAAAAAGSAHKIIPYSPPTLVKYGITADEANRFGLPCGGTLELCLSSTSKPRPRARIRPADAALRALRQWRGHAGGRHLVAAFKSDRRSCVIALTHDSELDDLALMEALNNDAFYIGAIGSRRNNAARRQRMALHFDIPEASLARLRGPIGIYIGSKTPPEIAVSVLAEVLAVKSGVTLPRDREVGQAKDERMVAANEVGELVCAAGAKAL